VLIYSRSITPTEVSDLWNGGSAITCASNSPPVATLVLPINTTNYTTGNTVSFEYTCTDAVKVDNCTLYVDGASEDFDDSETNGTYYYSTGFADGEYNWSVVAWNNNSLSHESETWFFNVSYVTGIEITLNTPVDTANLTRKNVTFNYDVIDNYGVDNVSLFIDGSLDHVDTSQVNGTYEVERNISDGSHSWYVEVYDNDSNGVNSSTYSFDIDTTPFIEFLTPPTLINYANITQEYIPMGVNVSTPYFENITYSLRNANGTNYSQFYAVETYDINFTNMPDAHYHYDVTICTTTDQCNTTETRHINHDTIAPTLSSAYNLTNLTAYSLPINSTWSFNATDPHTDNCYYNTTDHAIKVITCNSTEITEWATAGTKDITFCANDTFGNADCSNDQIIVYFLEITTDDTPNPVIEGSLVTYDLWITEETTGIPTTTATLIHNGTYYSPSFVSSNATTYHFQENVTILSGLGSLTGENVSFNWIYNITGLETNKATATETTTVFSIEFDDCSNFSDVILNWTLYDEETATPVNASAGSLVELDLLMTDPLNPDLEWAFNSTWTDEIVGSVCVPTGLLGNDTNYVIELTFGFESTDRVREFFYLDHGALTSASGFNIITPKPNCFNGSIDSRQHLIPIQLF